MTYSRILKALEKQSRECKKVFRNKIKRKLKFFLKLSMHCLQENEELFWSHVTQKRRRREESGRKIRSDALAEEEIKLVENFFNRDDISRICPGKKDFLSVKTSEGRELRQKKILLVNVNEAYELFKKEEPGLKIGRSKFASLRPCQVMPMSLHDQEVCMCKYHENINMILDGLKNIVPEVPKYSEDLLIQTVCSLNQAKCMDRECQACGIAKPLDELFEGIDDNTAASYFQWET